MIDQQTQLELENLNQQRRHAVAEYVRTGDLQYWREVREISETIAALSELEEQASTDGLGEALTTAAD